MCSSSWRLGISSGHHINHGLRLAVELQVPVVELACQHRGQWPVDLTTAVRQRIAAEARARELELVVHSDSAVNVAESHPAVREAVKAHLREYLELAVDVGARRVVVHAGLLFDSTDRATALRAAVDTLGATAVVGEQLGITAVLENMNVIDAEIGYLGTTADDVLTILDTVNSPALRACADIGHAHLLPGGVAAFVGALGHRIDYVQLTDNDGVIDDHLALGAGTLDLGVVESALAGIGYTGPVVIELDDEDARRASVAAVRLRPTSAGMA